MTHSDKFNIGRCLRLIRHNLTYNKRVIYYVAALYAILGIIATLTSSEKENDPVNFIIICMILTFSWAWTYSEEQHKLQQIMLPASSVEKFAAQIMQAVLLTVSGLMLAILVESIMHLAGIHDSEPVLPAAINYITTGTATINGTTVPLLPAIISSLAVFFAARAANSLALTLFCTGAGIMFLRLLTKIVPDSIVCNNEAFTENCNEIVLSSTAMFATGCLCLWMAYRDFKRVIYPD